MVKKATYQTTLPVQLAVQPDLKGYVLVTVFEDVTGYAVPTTISAADLKPKIGHVQSRAARLCRRLTETDTWNADARNRYQRNYFSAAPPTYLCGIEYPDNGNVRPIFLDRLENYQSFEQRNPQDHPMAKIYWCIYRLDAGGMTFERVAAQYP
jgi:hypothetical protein